MSAIIEILLRKVIEILLNWLVKNFTTKKLMRAGLMIYRAIQRRVNSEVINLKYEGWLVGAGGGKIY